LKSQKPKNVDIFGCFTQLLEEQRAEHDDQIKEAFCKTPLAFL